MSRIYAAALLVTILTGCATATPFRPAEQSRDGNGYQYVQLADDGYLLGSVFTGNAHTRRDRATEYSVLAALEYCNGRRMATAFYGDPEEYSKQATYTDYQSQTFKINGHYQTYATSTPVTLTFPKFLIPFRCFEHIHVLAGLSKGESISRELAAPYVKDFKGALLAKKVESGAKLKDGDVLISINGARVEDVWALQRAVDAQEAGAVKLLIVREGVKKTIDGEIQDVTDQLRAVSSKTQIQTCRATLQKGHYDDPDDLPPTCVKMVELAKELKPKEVIKNE